LSLEFQIRFVTYHEQGSKILRRKKKKGGGEAMLVVAFLARRSTYFYVAGSAGREKKKKKEKKILGERKKGGSHDYVIPRHPLDSSFFKSRERGKKKSKKKKKGGGEGGRLHMNSVYYSSNYTAPIPEGKREKRDRGTRERPLSFLRVNSRKVYGRETPEKERERAKNARRIARSRWTDHPIRRNEDKKSGKKRKENTHRECSIDSGARLTVQAAAEKRRKGRKKKTSGEGSRVLLRDPRGNAAGERRVFRKAGRC